LNALQARSSRCAGVTSLTDEERRRLRSLLAAAVPVLQASEPWSLFDQQFHDAHFAAVRRLYRMGTDAATAPRRRFDPD
jgi:hypothetical protein